MGGEGTSDDVRTSMMDHSLKFEERKGKVKDEEYIGHHFRGKN